MTYRELDTVVLVRDLPDVALCSGDRGTIVHVHTDDVFEVEFLSASGATTALLELTGADLRRGTDHDQIAVRNRSATALAE